MEHEKCKIDNFFHHAGERQGRERVVKKMGEHLGIQSLLVLPHIFACFLPHSLVELGLGNVVPNVFWPRVGNCERPSSKKTGEVVAILVEEASNLSSWDVAGVILHVEEQPPFLITRERGGGGRLWLRWSWVEGGGLDSLVGL